MLDIIVITNVTYFQGAAWVYLLLGSAGGMQDQTGCPDNQDNHDRVSASSGIASGSGTSSQPWLEDQDLSGSSCECTDTSASSRKSKRSSLTRRQRNHNNNSTMAGNVTKAQCHGNGARGDTCNTGSNRASPVSSRESNCSPGLNSAYRAMVSLAGNRTPSIEQSTCLTETTDCPSDISVITSISAVPTSQPAHVSDIESRLAGFTLTNHVDRMARGGRDDDVIQRVSDTSSRGKVTLPPTHLRALVRDRLRAEGISLSSHPYTQVQRVVNKHIIL